MKDLNIQIANVKCCGTCKFSGSMDESLYVKCSNPNALEFGKENGLVASYENSLRTHVFIYCNEHEFKNITFMKARG